MVSVQRAIRRFAYAVGLTMSLVSPMVADTLMDALAQAYQTHPSLEVARSALRAADEGIAQARAGGRPSVSANANANWSDTDTGGIRDSQSVSIQGAWTIYDGGGTFAAIDAARARVNAARARLVLAEQSVLLSALTAYEDVRRDEQLLALTRNNVYVISRQLQAARDRFEVGAVTRTVVAQAEARLAAARSNLVAAEGALSRSRDAYIAAIGLAPGSLAPSPAAPALPGSVAEAEALAMQSHPTILAARENEEAAAFAIEQAQAATRPRVTISGNVTHSNDTFDSETNSASVGIGASVPLYQGGALASTIRQAIAARDQARAELHDAGRQVRLNVASAWSNLTVARASISASRQQIRAARVAFEGISEEARLGARTTLDVLDAEQDVLDAQSSLITAQRNATVAAYTVLSAVGLLTVNHLGVAVDAYDPNVYFDAVQGGPWGLRREAQIDDILERF